MSCVHLRLILSTYVSFNPILNIWWIKKKYKATSKTAPTGRLGSVDKLWTEDQLRYREKWCLFACLQRSFVGCMPTHESGEFLQTKAGDSAWYFSWGEIIISPSSFEMLATRPVVELETKLLVWSEGSR
jgi:hypothetical protein